jgi:hypothetical protein
MHRSGNLCSFDTWLLSLNRTRSTGHRWRKQFPWLKVVNVCGKNYITRETIEDFERRATSGELAKDLRPK